MLSAFNPKLIRANFARLPEPNPSFFQGGTYIVTGANTGLGFATAKNLVKLSASRVVLAVRSQKRGDAAKDAIETETGKTDIAEVWSLDLSSFDSVKAFAKRVIEELERVDGLIENASVSMEKWKLAEGVEMDITVNVLGTFLLALLLLSKLKDTANFFHTRPHLSVVTSGAGFFEKGTLEAIEGDIVEELSKKSSGELGFKRYCISKLMQIYAIRQLAATCPLSDTGVVIDMISPGLVYTDLDRHGDCATKIAMVVMRAFMGRTAHVASRTVLHGISAGEEAHGKYLSECLIREDFVPDWMNDENGVKTQKRVWNCIVKHLEDTEPGCLEKALAGQD